MKGFIDNKGRVGAVLILIFSCVYLNLALQLVTDTMGGDNFFTSKTLPVSLAVLSIFCCIAKILLPATEEKHDSISEEIEGYAWKPTFWIVLITSIYTLSFNYLGFILATIMLLNVGFMVLGESNWKKSLLIAIAITMSLWLILTQIFALHLSAGNLYYSFVGV
jgi:putative tricarboxylic transport membrane protein